MGEQLGRADAVRQSVASSPAPGAGACESACPRRPSRGPCSVLLPGAPAQKWLRCAPWVSDEQMEVMGCQRTGRPVPG